MNDSTQIDAIVREVLRRLAEFTPAARAGHETGFRLSEQVITLDVLRRLPADSKLVRLQSGAILTPAAADELRDRGVRVERGADSETANPSAPALFVENGIALPSDVAPAWRAARRGGPPALLLEILGSVRGGRVAVAVSRTPHAAVIAVNRHPAARAVYLGEAVDWERRQMETGANVLVVEAGVSAAELNRLCAQPAGGVAPANSWLTAAR